MNYPEPDLDELYRDLILDHYRHPRNRGALQRRTTHVEGYNPLCGDEVELELLLGEDGIVEDIAFRGRGCSISQASSSMMTAAVKGHTKADALRLSRAFKRMMTNPEEEPAVDLGDLEAFEGVAKFPVRVKCATLAWHVLEEGLEQGAGEGRVEVT